MLSMSWKDSSNIETLDFWRAGNLNVIIVNSFSSEITLVPPKSYRYGNSKICDWECTANEMNDLGKFGTSDALKL